MSPTPTLDMSAAVEAALPLVTLELPGIGGVVKASPEDFEVEEVPAYEPAGEGDFLFLLVEKRDMPADRLLREVASALGLPRAEIGCAGLKDRRAVTRQWLSVPAGAEPLLHRIDGPGLRVLDARRHGNKLRTGHLLGNRFTVVVRDVGEDAVARAQAIVEALARLGFPGFFGGQRFGHDGQTAAVGLDLLRGERTRETKRVMSDRFRKRLAISAAQSLLYNTYLIERLRRVPIGVVLDGDLLARRDSGGQFTVTDLDVEQARYDAGEVVHTGPMYGRKTRQPTGEALALEEEILARAALPSGAFDRFGKLALGTRRANVVFPQDLEVEALDGGVRLRFFLPKGAYATVLLREIRKVTEQADASDPDDGAP